MPPAGLLAGGMLGERTGLVAFSLHYPWSAQLPVHSLDGGTVLPPLEPPATANPNILPLGL